MNLNRIMPAQGFRNPLSALQLQKIMIATKESFEPHSSEQLPNSHQGLCRRARFIPRCACRCAKSTSRDTKSYTGAIEPNAPVRVYDCSGPWGDPGFHRHVRGRLARAARANGFCKRGDVEEYDGREVKPQDNGYLSGKHAEFASKAEKQSPRGISRPQGQSPPAACAPRPGKSSRSFGMPAQGIITPEMEFIAIRENMGRANNRGAWRRTSSRNDLDKQHAGSQPARATAEFTPSVFRTFPAAHSRRRSRRNSSATKSPPAAPSFRSNINHPGNRADDHRPQFPGEDQRQHRQQRRRVEHRGGSREDALGHQVGRGHRHGSVHRQEHPRHARMDFAQLARAHRHRADLPGAGKSRRQGRGTDLGNLPRHAHRAGRAGRGLFHHPRRRAAALHPADRAVA